MHYLLFILTLLLPVLAHTDWESHALSQLLARQVPGTPKFACHENCGGIITIAKGTDYCDNSDFKSKFSACLACANTFDIWRFYGTGVEVAGGKCKIAAVPSASGAVPNPSGGGGAEGGGVSLSAVTGAPTTVGSLGTESITLAPTPSTAPTGAQTTSSASGSSIGSVSVTGAQSTSSSTSGSAVPASTGGAQAIAVPGIFVGAVAAFWAIL